MDTFVPTLPFKRNQTVVHHSHFNQRGNTVLYILHNIQHYIRPAFKSELYIHGARNYLTILEGLLFLA